MVGSRARLLWLLKGRGGCADDAFKRQGWRQARNEVVAQGGGTVGSAVFRET